MSNPHSTVGSDAERNAALAPGRPFDRVLLDLSMSDAVTSGDLEGALREICAAASRALDVSRTNVWLFDPAHTHLREAVSVVSAGGECTPPVTLAVADNPPYFAALQQGRIIAADDVYADARTTGFGAIYLRPRGITSTLDAAIRLHGDLLGVICHEHVGVVRSWVPEEERFAASLGDLVALAIVADERAKAQRAVRASEARYRMLIDGVRDVIFNLDPAGTLTSVNPALTTLLGFPAAEWIGRHFAGLLHPGDAALGQEIFVRALSGAEVPNFEIRLRDARGQTAWFEFTIAVERDGPQVRNIFGVGREITARKEDAELSAAMARVGQELIASVDLPQLLDRLCRVTTEVLGCDASYTFLRDETLGAFVRTASFGDPPQLAETLHTMPILDEHTGNMVERLAREGVVVFHVGDGVIAPALWDAYGTRSSMVIALLRGTQVVGAQAAAFRRDDADFGPHHVRIAHGIARLASLALANARLVGELETAGRIKSDFVATMSHELRTPLNVILGYTDLILLEDFGTLTPQQAETLTRVRSSAAELQELIEATLDLSRLESGAVALRLDDADLRRWLDDVRRETAPLRERKPALDVRWQVALPDTLVRCDALKLKVILKNLIGNALKFTQEGFVEVRVTVDAGLLTMTVEDSGIGMTPDVSAVIFEPFRQGDASLTRPYGGVGLGLYIVRRLVDALHGRIEVTSEVGRGSHFRVEVPLEPHATRGV